MQICKIAPAKLPDALDLVWEVFCLYDAPEYEQMGIQTFRHFLEHRNMLPRVNKGEMTFWGCYLNNYLVGVIALREGQHISLLFVRDKFHHLGVATRLVKVAVDYVALSEPEIRAVTVNSSPYAVGFYQKVGFCPLSEEKQKDGIRFTPMRMTF